MREAGAETIGEAPAIVALVGNPKPLSRTRSVAEGVAGQIAAGLAEANVSSEVTIVDLGDLGGRVLGTAAGGVDRALGLVLSARVLVVASPTYKASYSGLLKAFLDRLQGSALEGVVAVPVMVGASPRHHLALEAHLRPLLIELGASCPSGGLFVLEQELDELDSLLAEWCARWLGSLQAAVLNIPHTER